MANERGLLALCLLENQQFNALDKGNYTLLLILTCVLCRNGKLRGEGNHLISSLRGGGVLNGFGSPDGVKVKRWLFELMLGGACISRVFWDQFVSLKRVWNGWLDHHGNQPTLFFADLGLKLRLFFLSWLSNGCSCWSPSVRCHFWKIHQSVITNKEAKPAPIDASLVGVLVFTVSSGVISCGLFCFQRCRFTPTV